MAFDKPRKPRSGILFSKNKHYLKSIHPKSTSKVQNSKWKVSENCNKVGEKYIVVKKSELSAEGTKRDVENTPIFTRSNCILARRSRSGKGPSDVNNEFHNDRLFRSERAGLPFQCCDFSGQWGWWVFLSFAPCCGVLPKLITMGSPCPDVEETKWSIIQQQANHKL